MAVCSLALDVVSLAGRMVDTVGICYVVAVCSLVEVEVVSLDPPFKSRSLKTHVLYVGGRSVAGSTTIGPLTLFIDPLRKRF